jgi:hypothetical protein
MNENKQPDLATQFRELGENLKLMFQSAWESEEAQNFKVDIKNGLEELGNAANQAIEDFQASETGQKIQVEAEDFKARVESGEVESKAREELSKVLEYINDELQKVRGSFDKAKTDPEE